MFLRYKIRKKNVSVTPSPIGIRVSRQGAEGNRDLTTLCSDVYAARRTF